MGLVNIQNENGRRTTSRTQLNMNFGKNSRLDIIMYKESIANRSQSIQHLQAYFGIEIARDPQAYTLDAPVSYVG